MRQWLQQQYCFPRQYLRSGGRTTVASGGFSEKIIHSADQEGADRRKNRGKPNVLKPERQHAAEKPGAWDADEQCACKIAQQCKHCLSAAGEKAGHVEGQADQNRIPAESTHVADASLNDGFIWRIDP